MIYSTLAPDINLSHIRHNLSQSVTKETSGFEELIRGVFDFDAPEDKWNEELCINIAAVAVNHLASTNKTPSPLEIKGVQRALSEMGLRTEKRTKRGYLYRIPPKTQTTYYR